MKKYIIIFIFISMGCNGLAQTFTPLPPGFGFPPFSLCYDSIDSLLYAGGPFVRLANGDTVNQIAVWNGSQWDTLGSGVMDGGIPRKIIKYDNKIFVGGTFGLIGNVASKGIAFWDGANWNYVADFLGVSGYPNVLELYVDNGDLYIGGAFITINGSPAGGIVRYDGSVFHTYPPITSTASMWGINSIVVYNGELYAGGNFSAPGGKSDIVKFDGTNWVSVGGGLSGANSVVNDLIVYNGDLYVSGHFLTAYGDPGNLIAKWNGTTWSSVGSGLNGGNCFEMKVFDNKLYVGGTLTYAGGVPITAFAYWDGFAWYNTGTYFNNGIGCIEPKDSNSLFIGGGFTLINSDSIFYVAEYNLATGLYDEMISNGFELFPNPAKNQITISFPLGTTVKGKMAIYNVEGKTIMDRVIENESDEINIEFNREMIPGMYEFQLISGGKTYCRSFIIQ